MPGIGGVTISPLINLGARRSGGLSSDLLAKFLALWEVQSDGSLKNIAGSDDLTINNKDWSGSYIPYTSSATFNIPNTVDFQNADSDNLWYNSGVLDVTVNDLVDTNWSRTFVKYSNTSPYNITKFGILKSGETLTDSDKNNLSAYFMLDIYYFGVWNDYGYLKENR